jgi:hypothetical protein
MTTKTPTIAPEDVRPGVWLIDEYGSLFDVKYLHAEVSRKDPDLPYETHYFVCADPMNEIHFNLSDCSPIPLTESVLEACGFVKSMGSIAYRIGKVAVLIWNAKHATVEYSNIELPPQNICLHELQNLFRSLTKTDLTINAAQLSEAVKNEQR